MIPRHIKSETIVISQNRLLNYIELQKLLLQSCCFTRNTIVQHMLNSMYIHSHKPNYFTMNTSKKDNILQLLYFSQNWSQLYNHNHVCITYYKIISAQIFLMEQFIENPCDVKIKNYNEQIIDMPIFELIQLACNNFVLKYPDFFYENTNYIATDKSLLQSQNPNSCNVCKIIQSHKKI